MIKVTTEITQPIGAKWWLKLLILGMGVLLVLDSIQILNMSSIVASVDKYNQGVVSEIGGFRGDVQSFSNDLNEIRRFLLLPERDYSSSEQAEAPVVDESQATENQMGLYAFLDKYSANKKIEQSRQDGQKAWDVLLRNPDFLAKMKSLNLSFEPVYKVEMQSKFVDRMAKNIDGTINQLVGQPIFSLFFSPEENLFKMQSALGDKKFSNYRSVGFPTEVGDYIAVSLSEARIKKIEQKRLSEEQAKQADQAGKATFLAQKDDFERSLKDPAFTESLTAQGLKIVTQSKQENNKLIYDVTDLEGKVKFSFAMEISSGMIKVIEGNQEIDVKSFLNSDGSKKKL